MELSAEVLFQWDYRYPERTVMAMEMRKTDIYFMRRILPQKPHKV